MRHLLYFAVIIVALYGCKNNSYSRSEVISIPEKVDTLFVENVSEYEIIRLETTNNSLISHINKVKVFQDEIFVLDLELRKLSVFDKTGKFLRNIGRMGRGPGEFMLLENFEIDYSRNELLLLDGNDSRLLIYDTDGNYKSSVYIRNMATSVARMANGNFVLLYGLGELRGNDNYILTICDPKGNVLNRYIENPVTATFTIRTYNSLIPLSGGSIYFMPQFGNVVYSISETDKIIPVWEMRSNSGLIGFSDIVDSGITDDSMRFLFEFLKDKDYLMGDMAINERYVCVENKFGSSTEWVVFEKNSKQAARFKNDLFGYSTYLDDNDNFWAAVYVDAVKEIGEPWNDGDNPPLVRYKLKEF